MVVSPCYVLLVFCEQFDKGAGQFPLIGFSKTFDGKLTPRPFFMPVRGAKSSFKFIP